MSVKSRLPIVWSSSLSPFYLRKGDPLHCFSSILSFVCVCVFVVVCLPRGAMGWSVICFVCLILYVPGSQQFFRHIGMGLPGLNQY